MQSNIIKILSGALFTVVLVGVHSEKIFAQTETSSTTSTTTAVTEDRLPRARIVQQSLSRQQQTRITNLAANISNRFDATVARLEGIMLRIESRIEKMETSGFDMEATNIKLEEAHINLSAAKEGLRDIDAKVASATSSEKPQDAWMGVRNAFVTTRTHLVATRQSLREVIALMKQAQPLQQSDETTASSTTQSI